MFWNRSRICGGIKNTKEEPFREAPTVEGEQMHLYLTRHHGPQEDGEETREWQTEAVCRDGIHVEKERPCITEDRKEHPLISGTPRYNGRKVAL